MSRGPELRFEFPAAYELRVLPRLPARAGLPVFTFPGGTQRAAAEPPRTGQVLVRSDDPRQTYDIAPRPITDVLVLPIDDSALFADPLGLARYGAAGKVWHTELASDDFSVVRVEGDRVVCSGFRGGHHGARILVDLRTGEALP